MLVVDDSPMLRRIVCALLADDRYRPLEAATAEEALEMCAAHAGEIDMLLTDVIMPQMSGRALAERLREEHGIVRVLCMRGYDDEIIAHQSALAEGTFVLQKPFLEADLLRAVRRVLDDPSARTAITA